MNAAFRVVSQFTAPPKHNAGQPMAEWVAVGVSFGFVRGFQKHQSSNLQPHLRSLLHRKCPMLFRCRFPFIVSLTKPLPSMASQPSLAAISSDRVCAEGWLKSVMKFHTYLNLHPCPFRSSAGL